MKEKTVRFVVFRYKHHSPHSGYSRMPEFADPHYKGETITVDKSLPRSIIRERMLWKLSAGTPGYNRAAMATELNVAWKILKESKNIYHFLYGETTYHYAGNFNNVRQNRIVATFHLPPTQLKHAVQMDWHLRQLSAVVCVGRNQQDFFSRILPPDRIFFAPLGVDTEYFTPPATFESRDENLCLIVGSNYRDYPTLRGVIELIAYLRPETQFVAVTSPQNFGLIGKHPNLSLRSGIPEADLRNLYCSAALMIMPLYEATANNAILEGLACGTPIIVSDVGAIRDYVDPESALLIPPQNAKAMANAALDILNAPKERKQLSEKARKQAIKLSWPAAAKKLHSVYEAIS
jgi:glycosyltransferase involved in cell wall biosynthesis